jgi:hypothetical protein
MWFWKHEILIFLISQFPCGWFHIPEEGFHIGLVSFFCWFIVSVWGQFSVCEELIFFILESFFHVRTSNPAPELTRLGITRRPTRLPDRQVWETLFLKKQSKSKICLIILPVRECTQHPAFWLPCTFYPHGLEYIPKCDFVGTLGGVAQMAERLLRMQEAQGSIPCSSIWIRRTGTAGAHWWTVVDWKSMGWWDRVRNPTISQRNHRTSLPTLDSPQTGILCVGQGTTAGHGGDVAQMAERMLSMHEAQGSIPCFSSL